MNEPGEANGLKPCLMHLDDESATKYLMLPTGRAGIPTAPNSIAEALRLRRLERVGNSPEAFVLFPSAGHTSPSPLASSRKKATRRPG